MFLLHQVSKGMRARLAAALAEFGLTNLQYTAMSVLRDREPLSSAELSRRVNLTPQTVREVVSGLEESGWIARSEDKANRRILNLRLTSSGRKLIDACEKIADDIEIEVFRDMPKAQLLEWRDSLRRILHEFREEADTPEMKPKKLNRGRR